MRAGLLQAESGKGPGSGAKLTAEAVALLVIAVLVTDSLSGTEDKTRVFASLKQMARRTCPVTGKATFASGLAAVLSSPNLSSQAGGVVINRSEAKAALVFPPQGEKSVWSVVASSLARSCICDRFHPC